MIAMDSRATQLHAWLQHDVGLTIDALYPASSDASFRRYFRVHHPDGTYIVMDAPPEHEDTAPFIQVAHLLQNAKVNVPQIHQQHLAKGFLLLDDFGSECLLDVLKPETADNLYQNAFTQLLRIQTSGIKDLPLYDTALLTRELDLFYTWFAQRLLQIEIPVNLQQLLNTFLIESALSQPQVCVHRDYHSRNLMFQAQAELGVIDFQDAVIGAITYDLVSLLRDCYIAWPAAQLNTWIADYFQKLTNVGLISCSLSQFTRWFDLMGLQRHLKAIGIFSRLYLRDNKPGYLKDIPRTMNYVVQVCENYPELAELYIFLHEAILPVYLEQIKSHQ